MRPDTAITKPKSRAAGSLRTLATVVSEVESFAGVRAANVDPDDVECFWQERSIELNPLAQCEISGVKVVQMLESMD